MSTATPTPAKKGFFTTIVGAVDSALLTGANTVDSVITNVAAAAGKLIPAGERAKVEEGLSDVVEGLKVDDTAAAATVAPAPAPAPAAPTPAAPAAS